MLVREVAAWQRLLRHEPRSLKLVSLANIAWAASALRKFEKRNKGYGRGQDLPLGTGAAMARVMIPTTKAKVPYSIVEDALGICRERKSVEA